MSDEQEKGELRGVIMRFTPEAPLVLGPRPMKALRATGLLDDPEIAKRVFASQPIPKTDERKPT